jgi:hypothetical protein
MSRPNPSPLEITIMSIDCPTCRGAAGQWCRSRWQRRRMLCVQRYWDTRCMTVHVAAVCLRAVGHPPKYDPGEYLLSEAE